MTEIRIIKYALGSEALAAETLIKKTYAPYQTKRTDKVFTDGTGNTELFEIDLYREIYGTENWKQVG